MVTKWGVAIAQLNLGMTALARGDLGHAQELLVDGLSRAAALSDIALIADALGGLASVAERRGQPLRAARLLGGGRPTAHALVSPWSVSC